MRKNYIYLVFFFLLSSIIFAQKVILTPTAVNGASVSSSGPINLGSAPSSIISLGIRVEMPAIPGNTGTINIYSLNGLNANVVSGGNGGFLIFNEGKVASRSFVVNLNWSAFPTSGGYIYAEYKTGGNVVYKSGYIAVVKNATMGGGTVNPPADAPNPSKIVNTLCCNQTIRQGDKPAPITGSQYLNPYENYIYGINSSWSANGNGNLSFINLDNVNKILNIDYMTELGNYTVIRKLGYNGNNDLPNKSNTVTIAVVPSPILRNEVTYNEPLNSEGFIELSNLKALSISGSSSVVNLKVLENPFYTIQNRDPGVNVDGYKWEYTKTNSALGGYRTWITIPNENSTGLDFHDPSEKTNLEDTYYLVRRITIYKDISRVSNIVKVVVRGLRFNNTICCDQILKIQSPSNFETPQIIIGSIPSVDSSIVEGTNFTINYITYQWQSQSIQRGTSPWVNIPGATSKDYLPAQPLTVGTGRDRNRFETSYKYRRIVTANYSFITNKVINESVSSYSNETSLDGTTSEPYIQIYPNPTSSILNIECTVDISTAKVTISNIMGNIVNSNNYSILNSKLISIDVANFITGTYFITIENPSLGILQRTFIKQ